ncbi:sigma-70 family RNA polymerase sigma factor [Solwaraspora sp. WMMD1047]|uniref:RNA polymerase sigma factor n=1 Tax=Solwaraspora sp. WMMD1047 TaxID=3016102 RepID=UPI002417B555|nr:sigma-70 family RNA polymerase sigma factor [Solwaraspora sp. WMMD1047]MDG4829508.1 sigma-70 family RNA polymerase sigma factor [Solwaraspora sp. WMMD1047]
MDDSDLASRFAAGGDDAFRSVFATFKGPVFGIALHVLADPGLAEEAVQMAFLGVWRSRARFDPERSLSAWIFGITRKAAIDIFRRERRAPATVDAPVEQAVEAFSVERLWEAWEVRRAIESLPADEADVMRLVHYYQMTHSEAATHLGVPVGTIKSRSHRAHRRLAEALGHLLDNPGATAPADAGGGDPAAGRSETQDPDEMSAEPAGGRR